MLTLANKNRPAREIANILHIHPSTVSRQLRRLRQNPDFYYVKPRPGRPRILSPRSIHHAYIAIECSHASTAADIQRQLFPHVSEWTVRRALHSAGLSAYIKRRKPLLTRRHRLRRRQWAESYGAWSQEDWNKVIFSDESKFNLVGSDGRQYCWRRPGEELVERAVQKTVKHGGGSLMVWGCITAQGVGRIYQVKGQMTATQYCQILSDALLGTLTDKSLKVEDVIFQQDNDSKHTARQTQSWLADHQIKTLPWPPQSPDMNPIEHCWEFLERRVRAQVPPPQTLDELWEVMQEKWVQLDAGLIQSLYESMPRRIEELQKARGMYTKY